MDKKKTKKKTRPFFILKTPNCKFPSQVGDWLFYSLKSKVGSHVGGKT